MRLNQVHQVRAAARKIAETKVIAS